MSDFGFLSPGRLAILILPVALTVGYLMLQARRRRYAVRFTTVEMLDQVAEWVAEGGRSLGKPTHYDIRDGAF